MLPRCHLLWMFLLVVSAYQEAYGQSLTIDEAVHSALQRHPQLKVAKSDIVIAQARLIDAGKLENPMLEFAVTSQVKDGPDREGSLFIGYSQTFPVTDKLLRQRDLGKAEVQVACAEVREVERNFIARVQEAYIRALGAKALIIEMQRIEQATEKSIDQARNQMAAAVGSELDVASAETEKVLASQDRILAEGAYRQALARLRPLLGIHSNDTISLSDNLTSIIARLDQTVSGSISTNDLKRADLVAAQVRKKMAQADQELARSEALEDWEFNAGYEATRTIDEPVGAERDRFLSMGVKIPLPVRKKGEGRIAETRAVSEKVDHEIAVIEAQQKAEVAAALAEVQAARLTAENLNDKVLPQLKSREGKTWQAYQEGLVNFNQIILLQQQQTRTQKATTQARIDEALALARLQHAVGSHPALESYNPCECPSYKPGTEPTHAPWALPVMSETKAVKTLKAIPVALSKPVTTPKQKKEGGLQKLGKKLFSKKR